MLDKLSASGAHRRVEPGRVMLAAAAHLLVIFGAIRLTTPEEGPVGARVVRVVDMVLEQPNPAPETAPVTSAAAETEIVTAPVLELLAPPPEVPLGIPAIVKTPPIDASVLRRAVAAIPVSREGAAAAAGRIVSAGEADDPASVLFQPAPRYPPVLQAAGLEGRVLLEFVIDTTGHAEPASLRVIERTAEGFDVAARETIEHSLFRPGRIRGRLVRQRTLQWVAFRIVR